MLEAELVDSNSFSVTDTLLNHNAFENVLFKYLYVSNRYFTPVSKV